MTGINFLHFYMILFPFLLLSCDTDLKITVSGSLDCDVENCTEEKLKDGFDAGTDIKEYINISKSGHASDGYINRQEALLFEQAFNYQKSDLIETQLSTWVKEGTTCDNTLSYFSTDMKTDSLKNLLEDGRHIICLKISKKSLALTGDSENPVIYSSSPVIERDTVAPYIEPIDELTLTSPSAIKLVATDENQIFIPGK